MRDDSAFSGAFPETQCEAPREKSTQEKLESITQGATILTQVWTPDPARSTGGRTRWVNRADIPFEGDLRGAVEGGGETPAAILLEYMRRAQIVKRWKAQPITLEIGTARYTPDFAFECGDAVYFVEVKQERFVTRKIEKDLHAKRNWLQDRGFELLLWTDRRILTDAVRANVELLWLCGGCVIDLARLEGLRDFIRNAVQPTIADVMDDGFEIGEVYAALWSNKIHADLTRRLEPTSELSLLADRKLLLAACNSVPTRSALWESFPSVRAA